MARSATLVVGQVLDDLALMGKGPQPLVRLEDGDPSRPGEVAAPPVAHGPGPGDEGAAHGEGRPVVPHDLHDGTEAVVDEAGEAWSSAAALRAAPERNRRRVLGPQGRRSGRRGTGPAIGWRRRRAPRGRTWDRPCCGPPGGGGSRSAPRAGSRPVPGGCGPRWSRPTSSNTVSAAGQPERGPALMSPAATSGWSTARRLRASAQPAQPPTPPGTHRGPMSPRRRRAGWTAAGVPGGPPSASCPRLEIQVEADVGGDHAAAQPRLDRGTGMHVAVSPPGRAGPVHGARTVPQAGGRAGRRWGRSTIEPTGPHRRAARSGPGEALAAQRRPGRSHSAISTAVSHMGAVEVVDISEGRAALVPRVDGAPDLVGGDGRGQGGDAASRGLGPRHWPAASVAPVVDRNLAPPEPGDLAARSEPTGVSSCSSRARHRRRTSTSSIDIHSMGLSSPRKWRGGAAPRPATSWFRRRPRPQAAGVAGDGRCGRPGGGRHRARNAASAAGFRRRLLLVGAEADDTSVEAVAAPVGQRECQRHLRQVAGNAHPEQARPPPGDVQPPGCAAASRGRRGRGRRAAVSRRFPNRMRVVLRLWAAPG